VSQPPSNDPFAAPNAEVFPVAASTKPPWSPRAVGVISFFFSFVAGGILLGLNYERLGQPEKKVPAIALSALAFAALFGVAMVLPDDSRVADQLLRWTNIGAAVGLAQVQKQAYQAHVARGGATASPWPVVGICLAVAVVLGAAFFGLMYMTGEF